MLIQEAGRTAGHPPIVLSKIAPLVPKEVGDRMRGGSRRLYFPYKLPKGTIAAPRDDMVSQLLALHDLKKAYEVKLNLEKGEPTFIKNLNDINKVLWDKVQAEPAKDRPGHYIQVLTNAPQSIYYVALIRPEKRPEAKREEFQDFVISYAYSLGETPLVDTFMANAQERLAREFHAQFLATLRDELGYTAPDEKQRTDFDAGDHGG